METKLLYLEDFTRLKCDANVIDIGRTQENHENAAFTFTKRSLGKCKEDLVLNQTVFYPQGGGQPCDTGAITSPAGKFIVEEVRFVEGAVRHIGHFEHGTFAEGEIVSCAVDAPRRLLHSRIHSAGHLVDWAIAELEPAWTPDPRGYHYPNGPYVTYAGALEGKDKEKLKTDLEEICFSRIKTSTEVSIRFMSRDEMKKISRSASDLPEGKPGRVIMFGNDPASSAGQDLGVPCGGTHVKNLSEIRGITIRKIKQEGANIRIGYDVAP